MRFLSRNKTVCYYANLIGADPVTDEQNRFTGTYETKYSAPVQVNVNVSAAKGETSTRQFGEDEAYDRVIVCDRRLPIDEYTLWWIDTVPDKSGTVPHDYITKKVARSINGMTVAVSKVHVNG
jgi:hypothetical protein